jgi:hypothetical protein
MSAKEFVKIHCDYTEWIIRVRTITIVSSEFVPHVAEVAVLHTREECRDCRYLDKLSDDDACALEWFLDDLEQSQPGT